MGWNKDLELRTYSQTVGPKEYARQYRLLYMQVHNHSDMRHSGKKYTNDKSKIEAIKAKYKNGVPDEVIKEMVDLK